MNEADSPNQQIGSPVPIEPAQMPTVTESLETASIGSAAPNSASGGGWQTVDFPGAISIDAIPYAYTEGWSHTEGLGESVLQGVIHYDDAEISPAATDIAASPLDADGIVQQLQQENAALRDRLLQVEQALMQQLEGQLAAALALSHGEAVGEVSSPLEAASAIEQRQPFELAQEHLHPLLQELERSRQTVQRQQSLVETLTEQLSSCQERIAHLERDCALTQQRHSEQVQQVLQAESACRDLRLRLHRQQQQTFQFKAALEKCLEMPTAYGHPVISDVALAGDAAMTEALSALLPKNPPVKPWSLTERTSHEPSDPSDLPRPLFRLLNHGFAAQGDDVSEAKPVAPFSGHFPKGDVSEGEAMPMSADSSALLDPDDPQLATHLMQLIFPVTAAQASYATADILRTEPLALTPFLETDVETESADADALPTLEVSSAITFVVSDRPSGGATAPLETATDETATEQNQHNAVLVNPDAIASASSAPLPSGDSTAPLRDDLATLIDPLVQTEGANLVAAAVVDRPPESVESAQTGIAASSSASPEPLDNRPLPVSTPTAIPPIFTANAAPVAASPLEDSVAPAHLQAAWTWRDRLVSAGKIARSTDTEQAAKNSSKPLALSGGGQQTIQPPASAASPTALTPISFAVPPSPIVSPLRATKKLASLAAVDLPTFSKR